MNETKYLHYRYSGDDGKVHARGGITFAYTEVEPGRIKVASARCALSDNFVKVTGRNKAGGRLKSERFAQTFEGTEADLLKVIERDVALYNHFVMPEHGGQFNLARKFSGKLKAKDPEVAVLGALNAVISNNQSGGITAVNYVG